MRTVRTTEVGPRLAELLNSVAAGDEVLITRDDAPVAKLTGPEAASLRDLRPSSVGAVLRPLSADDDLLEEMLDR